MNNKIPLFTDEYRILRLLTNFSLQFLKILNVNNEFSVSKKTYIP